MSTCGLAYVSELGGDRNGERSLSQRSDELATNHVSGQASAALPAASDHERRPGCLAWAAGNAGVALGRHGAAPGFDALRADNQDEWHELWKSRIKLIGAERRWQEMADAAFYYLNSSVHPSSPASTSIFGIGDLEELSLLFRPCDVGYRDLHPACSFADPAACRGGDARLPLPHPRRRRGERPAGRPARPAVCLGMRSFHRPGGCSPAGDGGLARGSCLLGRGARVRLSCRCHR